MEPAGTGQEILPVQSVPPQPNLSTEIPWQMPSMFAEMSASQRPLSKGERQTFRAAKMKGFTVFGTTFYLPITFSLKHVLVNRFSGLTWC
jgi:hypothetical protein